MVDWLILSTNDDLSWQAYSKLSFLIILDVFELLFLDFPDNFWLMYHLLKLLCHLWAVYYFYTG